MGERKLGESLRIPDTYVFPNPFVQKVRDEFGPPSPVAVVKDSCQPSSGCFKSLRRDRDQEGSYSAPRLPKGATKFDVLRGKELENEALSPSLRKDVELSLNSSGLLARRGRLTL